MKQNKKDIFFYIVLASLFIIYIFRAQYGVVSNDESLYLAIPYRFISGDAMLSEEWNLSQLSSIFLVPLLKIYMSVFKNSDGIYLVFRYIYLIYNLVVAILIFKILDKTNYRSLKCFIPLVYFCFIPYRVMALSYNTMLLSFYVLIGCILLKNNKNRFDYIIIGLLYGCGVLCNPFTIIIFIVYLLMVLFRWKKNDDFFNLNNLINIVIGGSVIFLILVISLIHNNSIQDILVNVELLLNDPTHSASFMERVDLFVGYFIGYKIIYSAWLILILLGFSKKYRKYAMIASLGYASLITIYMAVLRSCGYGFSGAGVNAVMFNMAIVGLQLMMYKEIKNKNIIVLYGFGFLYSLAGFIASNQGMYVFSIGASIMSIASFVAISDYYENKDNRKILVKSLLVVQIIGELLVMGMGTYFDGKLKQCDTRIGNGTFKGILTSNEKAEKYNEIIQDINSIDVDGKRCLYYQNMPYAYIENNSLVGSYSVWNETDSLMSMMYESYYQQHPNMIPSIIYVDKSNVEKDGIEVYREYANMKGYTLVELDSKALLLEKEVAND